jgi:hypothetical protein
VSAGETDPLEDLLARWEERLHEAAQRSRQVKTGDFQAAYYFRGVAETYKTALAELRALIDEPAETPAAPPALVNVPVEQVGALLSKLGLFPRVLTRHDDGAFTAVFSRLQPVAAARRTELLTGADPRLRIVREGNLRDTGDPYVEFGFVEG